MENEKDNKYFIIWLYISILLHLFVVIIMLTIKPTTSSSADPDPASFNYDSTQLIFMQDEPVTAQPIPYEPKQPQPQIATRIQGGEIISAQHSPSDPKEAQKDIPAAALSDDYKKGMQNQTSIEDQGPDGTTNILEDAIINQEEQLEKQVIPPTPIVPEITQREEPQIVAAPNDLRTFMESQEKRIASAEILKAVIQEKMQKTSELAQTIINKTDVSFNEEQPQPHIQKIISKKHRPADLGTENLSKVQLSKQTQEIASPKKKLSLQDLQTGFSQFLKTGNEQYYSVQGNAQHDDAESLKRASYYRQLGQMYNNAHAIAPNLLHGSQYDQPNDNSIIMITIERSGKISNLQMVTTSGVDVLDRHHMRIIESIGSFPPIPKYIEAPLQITATLRFLNDRSSMGTFTPTKIRR
jgi:hypothetical protein